MADGLTTAAGSVALGGTGYLAIASYFPGVDLSAVIGAFGGSLCFIFFAKDISNVQRWAYLLVGWIGGYMSAAEMLSLAWTRTSGFSSFVAGLICVVVGISIIEAFQTGTFPAWMQRIFGRFFGKKEVE